MVQTLAAMAGLRPAHTPLLAVENLCVTFRQRDRVIPAVAGLSYQLEAGRTLAMIGESGSGKTVSCWSLMGLLGVSATVTGSVRLDGTELIGLREREMQAHRGTGISMVFQDPARALNPTMRVGRQITEALCRHEPLDREAARERAVELLKLLRVPAPEQRFEAYPHELSGGTQQRVMIAIALAGRPRLLIADEATRSLDAITQAGILELLKHLQQQFGMALLLVSHDLSLAASYADEVLVMYAGRAVEHAPTRTLFERPRMRYTRALIDVAPQIDRRRARRFAVVRGQPPSLADLPTGCAFEPRCTSAGELCRRMVPPLQEMDEQHRWACWHPCTDYEAHR